MQQFNSSRLPNPPIKDDGKVHVICTSGRQVEADHVPTQCGYAVPVGGDGGDHCEVCERIVEDDLNCRSCRQIQLLSWAKRIGIDDADVSYDPELDLLKVNYTFGPFRPDDQKEITNV